MPVGSGQIGNAPETFTGAGVTLGMMTGKAEGIADGAAVEVACTTLTWVAVGFDWSGVAA